LQGVRLEVRGLVVAVAQAGIEQAQGHQGVAHLLSLL
jgi:hypothetical protein